MSEIKTRLKQQMESLRGEIDRITILVIGVISAAISLADIFGVLDGFPFIKEKIPVFVLLVLGILSAYLVFERRGSLDKLEKHLQQLTTNVNALGPKLADVAYRIDVVPHGAEFFHSTDKLLRRMTDLTIGSEHVKTLNLSPHVVGSPALDSYFEQVNDYIRQTSSPLKSFKNLSTLETPQKATWVMQRAIDLIDTGKMSTGVIPSPKSGFLICFHIVLKTERESYVFIYPPIRRGGAIDGLLLKGPEVTNIMLKCFDEAWGASSVLHEGETVHKDGLGLISKTHPSLKTEAAYIQLSRRVVL